MQFMPLIDPCEWSTSQLHLGLDDLFQTNTPFLLNVLRHPRFRTGSVDTTFIDSHPQLFKFAPTKNRAQKLLNYMGTLMVNGPQTPLATDIPPAKTLPTVPSVQYSKSQEFWFYKCSYDILEIVICNVCVLNMM